MVIHNVMWAVKHGGLFGGFTCVDDEPYGIWAQCVIEGDHNHGVGVAGQLWDDPLQETHKSLSTLSARSACADTHMPLQHSLANSE